MLTWDLATHQQETLRNKMLRKGTPRKPPFLLHREQRFLSATQEQACDPGHVLNEHNHFSIRNTLALSTG